jgi:hypothetical protein
VLTKIYPCVLNLGVALMPMALQVGIQSALAYPPPLLPPPPERSIHMPRSPTDGDRAAVVALIAAETEAYAGAIMRRGRGAGRRRPSAPPEPRRHPRRQTAKISYPRAPKPMRDSASSSLAKGRQPVATIGGADPGEG